MAGRTLSAYADEQTYQKVTQLARLEDRSTAQIVSAALRLYLRLPSAAHDALRRAEAEGPEQADEAAWAAGRALLNQRFDAIMAKIGEHMPALLPDDADEEAILAKAVELTRDRKG